MIIRLVYLLGSGGIETSFIGSQTGYGMHYELLEGASHIVIGTRHQHAHQSSCVFSIPLQEPPTSLLLIIEQISH